ncbi:hypothetical protein V6U90_15010 [Micromonospora sp. CPCC 206060]|uniref:hypothetical protein n=1 Tax=Micromonospora sp. CPCC 206060 TaxID=3122406 RepID=UPI002FEFFC84
MSDNRSLQPLPSGDPVQRSARLPARPGSDAPVHQPGNVHWSGSGTTREECWQQLSPGLQDRVNQRIGRMLDWWATDIDGRVSAVVLGTQALVAVNPTVNGAGEPAYELVTVHLDEASFRSAPVRGPSPAPAGREPAGSTRPGARPGSAPGSPAGPGGPLRLDEGFTDVLGMLPARAQQLMQDPFLAAAHPLRSDFFAYRTGSASSLNGATIRLWCYLTDTRSLTFCAAVGHGYREGTGARAWEATCWRATTRPGTKATGR